MSKFKQYKRKAIAELRQVTEAEIFHLAKGLKDNGISVSEADEDNGSPNIGDMIARNPQNHGDQWLVAAQYFDENFEEVGTNLVSENLSFGEAISSMKNGFKVQRSGWNGKGMYLKYFSPLAHGFADSFEIEGEAKPLLPFIMMKTTDDMYVPWLASQSDILADDWRLL